MRRAARCPQLCRKRDKIGMRCQRPIFDSGIQARQILHHHTACTNIHVSNFGIANLSIRQPNISTRCGKKAMWLVCHQRVKHGRFGKRNGVMFGLGTMTPAIHDAQDNWAVRGVISDHDDLIISALIDVQLNCAVP